MKTVIWLHSHFLFWMGGTKYIFEVSKEIASNKKYHVVVIVENASKLARDQYSNTNVQLISLNTASSTSIFYWLTLPWQIYDRKKRIKQVCDSHNINVKKSIVISSMFPMNVVAALLSKSPYQLCYEPFAFFYDREFTRQFVLIKRVFIWLLAFLYAPLDKWGVSKAKKVLTLNQVTQHSIMQVYGVTSQPVYAGVDSTHFYPFVSTELKNKYKDKKVAIHSTDYSPVKGTDRVIRAMQLVTKKVPDSLLLITSTIDNQLEKQKLIDLTISLGIEKHVEFLGFVPLELLPQYYSLALVLVQGSNSANSGTTSMALPVKEAMCCATPAIRPDIGGEDVIDGKSGYLVDPQNTFLLANSMVRLLSNPDLSKKMGQFARKSISQNYTWGKTTATLLKALQ